jgi:hypothetical protein
MVQGCAALAAAALLYGVFHQPVMAAIAAGMGTLTLVTGVCMPRAYTRLDQAVRWLARGLGIVVAWCALAPLYIIGFSIARAGLAVAGRDPLTRAARGAASTAWHTRPRVQRAPASYQQLY